MNESQELFPATLNEAQVLAWIEAQYRNIPRVIFDNVGNLQLTATSQRKGFGEKGAMHISGYPNHGTAWVDCCGRTVFDAYMKMGGEIKYRSSRADQLREQAKKLIAQAEELEKGDTQ